MSTSAPIASKEEQIAEIADDFASVTVTKIITPCGTRIEISASNTGHSIRLDPLELESLTWQTPDSFLELLGPDVPGEAKRLIQEVAAEDSTQETDPVLVSNEFARIEVTTGRFRGVDVLHLNSPKLGYSNIIAPIVLEALTRQDSELFSEYLETPFGPKGEAGHDH